MKNEIITEWAEKPNQLPRAEQKEKMCSNSTGIIRRDIAKLKCSNTPRRQRKKSLYHS